jgi:hypothetical protein
LPFPADDPTRPGAEAIIPDDFVTLTRDTPWARQIGCGALIALVLGAVGGGILYGTHHYYGYWNWDKDAASILFGSVFGGVGVIIALATLQQSLALRSPLTQVAICPGELARFETAQLRIRQPGPIRLRSLNARLVCQISERKESQSERGKHYWTSRFPHQDRIFESGARDIAAGGQFEQTVSFAVPSDAQPSKETADLRIDWRIEVWGRVKWWPDFMHPFTVRVLWVRPEPRDALTPTASGEPIA